MRNRLDKFGREKRDAVVKNDNGLAPLNEVLNEGLRLACFMADAQSVVFACPISNRSWIYPKGRGVQILDGPHPVTRFNLVLEVMVDAETRGSLSFYSDLVDFHIPNEALLSCVKLLGHSLLNRKRWQITQDTATLYRDFVMEISEGVWRVELRQPMPEDLTPQEQVNFIFDHAYLAECNPAMARMYGYKRTEELVGIAIRELLIPEDPSNHLYLENFVRGGYRLRNAESVEKDRDGQVRYFVNNLVGIFDSGRFAGAWGTQSDVTEYKKLEGQLKEAAKEAAEANQAKSAFLANVSHEIRTPLGVILGFADLALDSAGLSAENRGYISCIRRNGEQLTEILGEVLDLSKIEARQMEIEEIRFPLMPTLLEVLSFMEIHAREKGLVLSLEKIGQVPKMVKSDPTRLRQILNNLISNAIKFTEKGFVKVAVRMTSQAKVGTPLQLEFTVTDTGIGISPDLREKVFQAYGQAEASTTRRFGGTGLGLHLSKQLAHALGGDLRLEFSKDDQGSTFAFTISAGTFEGDLAPGPQATLDNSRALQSFRGKKVLVIEDSEDSQTLIKHYLNAVGIQVDVASNGSEGLSKMTSGKYDLVVLDIQLPGMNGHQVARSLRGQGFSQPIIALTAHALKEDREEAFRSGFNEYLTKPINRGVLMKTLGSRLGLSALH